MELTRIRISGFKSFSDPVELQVEGGLTGIVGPNGCGKSNIVEALRWAMGESSAKGLRGDDMEDVIFNGTGLRPAHDVAEVRIKLRGRAEGLVGKVDGEDLEVSRKLARGVGSTYRINGREARARDIQLLFADAGAGSRSPAIVSQGQIGFIVDAKPGDRRKLLEDAAGIGGLQTRRREAELKLEATRANLQRVRDLLTTQEARLAELRKQGRQAERYRKLAAELRQAETLLLLARQADAVAAAEAAAAEVAQAQAALAELAGAAATARRRRGETAAALPASRERAAEAGALAVRLGQRLESQRAAAGREAAHLEALERQDVEAAADLARAERAVLDLEAAATAAERELEAVRREEAEHGAALDQATVAERAAAAELERAQEALRTAVARAAESEAQTDATSTRRLALQERLAALVKERADLPSLDVAQDGRDQAGAAVARATEALAAAQAALAGVEVELTELEPVREGQRAAHLAAERDLAHGRQSLAEAERRLGERQAVATRRAESAAALERGTLRLAERRKGQEARAEALRHGSAEADPEARARELAAAEEALRAADGLLDEAREAAAAAEHARSEAAERLREAHRSADAVAAEVRVLETLVQESAEGGLLDVLTVPEELATALAAALGDDLLAGTDPETCCFWRELTDDGGPELPSSARSLADLVAAPPVLRARLRQVGLVELDQAAALQTSLRTGQRLVSPDGGVWRWDGLVRLPGAEETGAARVRHRLRLHAARDEQAELSRRIAAQADEVAALDAEVDRTRVALSEAEQVWRAADMEQLRARQRLDEAAKLAQRHAVEAKRLQEEEEALAGEAAELDQARAELARLSIEAGDLADLALEVERRLAELETAAETSRAEAAEAARLAAAHQAASTARQARRTAVERAQAGLERARAEAESLIRQAAETETAVRTRAAALDEEEARIEDSLALLERELDKLAAASGDRQAERALAEQAQAAADAAHRAAAVQVAAVRAELGKLEHRGETLTASLADLRARAPDSEALRLELERRRARLQDELGAARRRSCQDPAELDRLATEAGAADAAAWMVRQEQEGLEADLARFERELESAEAATVAARERLAVARSEEGHAAAARSAATAAVEERLQQPAATLLAEPETRTDLEAATALELETQVARLRAARERLGPVNLRAEAELAELAAALEETQAREAELQAAVDRLLAAIATLNKEGCDRLMAAFEAVDGHFRRLFTQLFGGGKAHLRLTGADDPLQAGLELEASPPGKKLASISLLSGGEKTLTALALVFGFFLAQPSPLCVLDEVDAPLDDANVDRFISLMQEIAGSTGTRFLVVTHHPLTMARMDRLYGVTMAERGISRLVSVALEQAIELRATA